MGRSAAQLLDSLAGLSRGAGASEEQKAVVEELVQSLEGSNPTPSSLARCWWLGRSSCTADPDTFPAYDKCYLEAEQCLRKGQSLRLAQAG